MCARAPKLCVVYKPKKRGCLSLIWAVGPQKKILENSKHCSLFRRSPLSFEVREGYQILTWEIFQITRQRYVIPFSATFLTSKVYIPEISSFPAFTIIAFQHQLTCRYDH